jgi:hypothetical protein
MSFLLIRLNFELVNWSMMQVVLYKASTMHFPERQKTFRNRLHISFIEMKILLTCKDETQTSKLTF